MYPLKVILYVNNLRSMCEVKLHSGVSILRYFRRNLLRKKSPFLADFIKNKASFIKKLNFDNFLRPKSQKDRSAIKKTNKKSYKKLVLQLFYSAKFVETTPAAQTNIEFYAMEPFL